ncbi:MAG: radical SAM protein, partial [Candidatus Heimdallarchaeota archaeon]|nr:radical SAM protein [Candidatus Heimdallarchaeota archaeon]
DPPDVLALSNYAWNGSLSLRILKLYKELFPKGITVLGGPNFPREAERIKKQWLGKYCYIDFIINDEGEVDFNNLIQRLAKFQLDVVKARSEAIKGCYFLNTDGELIFSPQPLLEDLETIPSPYLEGVLDKFIVNDIGGVALYPLFESTRGCPHSCTFCRNGGDHRSRVRFFSEDRFMAEISYVSDLLKRHNKTVPTIMITDQNFGSYNKDYNISRRLGLFHERNGFPNKVIVTTGKGNADNVLKTIEAFPVLDITLSVQSLDDSVLNNVKRKNFPLEKFRSYQKVVKERGKLGISEVILGLPGDTKEKHLFTVRKLLSEDIDFINPFSFMMLLGTIGESAEERKKYSYETKWRLIPGGFSEIDGEKIFESEEIVIGSNTMSTQDWLYLRRIHLWLVTIFNGRYFRDLRKLLVDEEIDFIYFLEHLDSFVNKMSESHKVNRIARAFRVKSQNEFFETHELLTDYYRDNYELLLEDKAGGNLLQKYKFLFYADILVFIDTLKEVLAEIGEQGGECFCDKYKSVLSVMYAKGKCVSSLIKGDPITSDKPEVFVVEHDIAQWLKAEGKSIIEFKYASPQEYVAYYDNETIDTYRKVFDNSGFTDEWRGKILHRLGDKYLLPTIAHVNAKHDLAQV